MVLLITLLSLFLILSFKAYAFEAPRWNKENPESVKDYIIYVAQKEGVNVGLAVAIADAESNFIWNAKNPHSTASGAFQFINGTFLGFCRDKYGLAKSLEDKNNPFIQANCAVYMLKEPNGYKHWLASKQGWERFFPTQELSLR